MSVNLQKLKKLFKVFKVLFSLSGVIYLLGGALFLVALIFIKVLGEVPKEFLSLSMFEAAAEKDVVGSLVYSAVLGLSSGILNIFIARFLSRFSREETPFSKENASSALKLGIASLVSWFASSFTAAIVEFVAKAQIGYSSKFSPGVLVLGICLIVFSFAVGYGAELEEERLSNSRKKKKIAED
mgnify:CR=1 FL=1